VLFVEFKIYISTYVLDKFTQHIPYCYIYTSELNYVQEYKNILLFQLNNKISSKHFISLFHGMALVENVDDSESKSL
jgi:hypothetical protein